MRTINVFVDTTIVNRILDIDQGMTDPVWEEDRSYLSKIVKQYIENGIVRFIVNPTVKQEIGNTKDPERRRQLLDVFNQFHFTPYNKTIFPFSFPATFVTEEEKRILKGLCSNIDGFEKDQKIFLDAVSNSGVQVLLTTDRKHLAGKVLPTQAISVFTPKEFFERLISPAQMP